MKSLGRISALLVACWISLGLTQAHALSIGYINASGGSISGITVYGHTVTDIVNPIGLTAGSLSTYDSVVVASNSTFAQPAVIGDALKTYADAGGGVVLTEFTFQGVWALAGGIMGTGYSPFTIDPLSSGYGINSAIGTVYDATDGILTGVNTGLLSTTYQANVGTDASAKLVADWTSGRHAIAYNDLTSSRVVGLNLFPSSISGENAKLLSNAVVWAASAPDGNGDDGQVPAPATLALLGLGLAGIGFRQRKQVKTA